MEKYIKPEISEIKLENGLKVICESGVLPWDDDWGEEEPGGNEQQTYDGDEELPWDGGDY